MRQPPSPLLLSARKRRPRRTPPRGARGLLPDTPPEEGQAMTEPPAAADTERCALVQPFPDATRSSADGPDEPEHDAPDHTSNR
jgi:hypothetical protein